MRKITVGRIVLAVCCAAPIGAQTDSPGDMVPVLIGFRQLPGPAEEALVRALGADIKRRFSIIPTIAASLPPAVVERLRNHPLVRVIEEDGRVYEADEYSSAWGVQKIRADLAHSNGRLGAGVKVAVIDTGVDCTHPELSSRCVGGRDFVANPDDNTPADERGHGTHVAGTIAAVLDDAGVAGVAPEVQIVPLRVLDENGSGSFSDVIAALEWVKQYNDANPGAPIRVTNNSYGSASNPGVQLEEAFQAIAGQVLHIAASGNARVFTCRSVSYPAAYASVVAVGATDRNDNRASFSCYGSQMELSAPGVDVYSTMPTTSSLCTMCSTYGYDYGTMSGTSMASPHVAGAAALVFSAAGSATPDYVRQRLRDTAVDLGAAGWDQQTGYGRVDAYAASNVGGAPAPPVASFTFSCTGLTCNFDASASAGEIAAYEWNFGDGASGSGRTASHAYAAGGTYSVTLTVSDSEGATDADTKSVSVAEPPASATMHIGDLDSSATRSGFTWTAAVAVTVHDESHAPVANATVSGSWSGGASGAGSCTTDGAGRCTIAKTGIWIWTTSAIFSVTGVSHGALEYDAAANHDPDGDSNGRSITVRRP